MNEFSNDMKQVADRLKGLREIMDVSVEEAAQVCHMEPEAYQKLETGAVDIPVGVLQSMAKKYGFSPDNIIVNGPGKMGGLPEMLQDGALVMLDNEEELELAIRTSENMEQPGNIGFRLNFEI